MTSLFSALIVGFLLASCLSGTWAGVCSSTGDPHISTFDGVSLDNYGVGEYFMIRSSEFTAQSRLEKPSCPGNRCRDDKGFPSYNRAAAFQRKGLPVIELDGGRHRSGKSPLVYLNGKSQGSNWPSNDHQWHKRQGVLFKRGGTYLIVDMGDGFRVRFYQTSYGFRDVWFEAPRSMRSKVAGICGNFDGSGNWDRELIARNGKAYKMDTHLHWGRSPRNYQPQFTRSWIVSQGESLFHAPTGSAFKNYRSQVTKYHNFHAEDIKLNAEFSSAHIQQFAEKICNKLNNKVLQTNCLVDSAIASQFSGTEKKADFDIQGIAKSEHHLLKAMIQAAKDKKQTRCGIPIDRVQELATRYSKMGLTVEALVKDAAKADSEIDTKCAEKDRLVKIYQSNKNKIEKELRLIRKIKGMASEIHSRHDEKDPLMKMLTDLEKRLEAVLKGHNDRQEAASFTCASAKTAKSVLLGKLAFERKAKDEVKSMKTTFDKAMAECEKKEKEYNGCIADRDEIALLVQKETKKAQESASRLSDLEQKVDTESQALNSAQNALNAAKDASNAQNNQCKNIASKDATTRATLQKDLRLVETIRKSSRGFSSKDHVVKIHDVLDTIRNQLKSALDNVGGKYTACRKTLDEKVAVRNSKKQARNSQQQVLTTVKSERAEENKTLQTVTHAKTTAQTAHDNKSKKCAKMPHN